MRTYRWVTRASGIALTVVVVATSLLIAPVSSQASGSCTLGSRDSDRDHLPDCWERSNGLRVGKKDQRSDKDNDGLSAMQEYTIDSRTSSDGSLDLPYRANDLDTNRNRVSDGNEDADGDGWVNDAEYLWGSDPLDPSSVPTTGADGCYGVPPKIPSNGQRDVTADLQTTIDAVPDGGCLTFPADGRYRMDGTLQIVFRNDFTINGDGAVLFTDVAGTVNPWSGVSTREQILIGGGTNITLDDLTIIGPNKYPRYNPTYEFEHGVVIGGTDGASITNMTIKHVYGDFIYVDDTADPPGSGNIIASRNILVSGGHFHVAGRQGMTIGASVDGVTFDNNVIDSVGRSAIDLEPIGNRVLTNITITNNTFRNYNLNTLAARGNSPINNVYFGGNFIEGQPTLIRVGPTREPDGSVPPYRDDGWTFANNVSDTMILHDQPAFSIQFTDNVTVVGNTQPFSSGDAGWGIGLGSVCNVTAGGNDFTGATALFFGNDPCNWVDAGGNIT